MNKDRYKLNHPHKMQEVTKRKVGRPSAVKEASHFDNSVAFREYILGYNHNVMRAGYCMRYCTHCGVGIRLMFYEGYYLRYHDGPCLCERCEKILHPDEPVVARITRGTGFQLNKDGTVRFQTVTIVGG